MLLVLLIDPLLLLLLSIQNSEHENYDESNGGELLTLVIKSIVGQCC